MQSTVEMCLKTVPRFNQALVCEIAYLEIFRQCSSLREHKVTNCHNRAFGRIGRVQSIYHVTLYYLSEKL